jgi:hypothetical protein
VIKRPASATDRRKLATGAVTLGPDAADHLADAFEQMDLLLATRSVDAGLVFLVALLHHLQAMRRAL